MPRFFPIEFRRRAVARVPGVAEWLAAGALTLVQLALSFAAFAAWVLSGFYYDACGPPPDGRLCNANLFSVSQGLLYVGLGVAVVATCIGLIVRTRRRTHIWWVPLASSASVVVVGVAAVIINIGGAGGLN